MPGFQELLQQGAANAWLFVPSAILLGALHGLEPGHSKTMMAAFIVAIRGTVAQAVLLGLAATVSHTAVVWVVALVGMRLGAGWSAEKSEPYFQVASAALIVAVALWMLTRTWRDRRREANVHGHDHHHDGHDDSHARAHAGDIRRRFASRHVTTGQIVVFGLTGGLIPCPAAITVLLLCLQLREFTLGVGLVLCFSLGLAATMIASGAIAALGVRHVGGRWSGFDALARRAPYVSGVLILAIGLYVGWNGWTHLP